MDGGAWGAIVHGVAKSRTRLSDFTHSLTHSLKLHQRYQLLVRSSWFRHWGWNHPPTEAVKQSECSHTAGGNVKWYNHFRNQLPVPYKVKHIPNDDPTWPNHPTLNRNKNLWTYIKLDVNVYGSLIQNCPKLETELRVLSLGMDKWCCSHTMNCYSATKSKEYF